MIPLLIGGICALGLMLGETRRASSGPWHNVKEEQDFLRERERSVSSATCRYVRC